MYEDYTPGRAEKVVRVDQATYERVRESARRERRTLSNQLAVLVERALAQDDADRKASWKA